jgi:hypothetical protein
LNDRLPVARVSRSPCGSKVNGSSNNPARTMMPLLVTRLRSTGPWTGADVGAGPGRRIEMVSSVRHSVSDESQGRNRQRAW